LAKALEPAIAYARDGFAVSEIVSNQWDDATGILAKDRSASATFLPNGRAPRSGEVFRNPHLAATLEQIASGASGAFYRGAVAKAIAGDLKKRNALLSEADLAEHRSDWVEPIATDYRGHRVLEMPPNTQGITALQMLNILEGFDLKALGHNSAAYLDLLVEAKRIAFADREAWLADFDAVDESVLARLLSKEYAAERRREIDRDRAAREYRPMLRAGSRPRPTGEPRRREATPSI
jgi:gamma-glutamyltranspeptidase/glutathione hydrolase